MTCVAVGIPVYEEPEGLHATLESLRDNTGRAVEIVLLPDGPDGAMATALEDLASLPQHGTAVPLGAPACFNRLARVTDAQVMVLLESGVRSGRAGSTTCSRHWPQTRAMGWPAHRPTSRGTSSGSSPTRGRLPPR